MRTRGLFLSFLLLCFLASFSSAFAQLPPIKTDTLHPLQDIQGSAGCSATEASACAQAAAKITPVVMANRRWKKTCAA